MTFEWKNPAAMGMIIVGAVLLLASMVVYRFVPRPTTQGLAPKLQQINDANAVVISGDQTARTMHLDAEKKLWTDPDAKITPTVLSRVNAAAQKCSVKVTAFRPEKAIVAGTLNVLPYFVAVEGTFTNAMKFEYTMEEEDPLLAVSTLQIASADSSSSTVTASISIDAYVNPKRPLQAVALASSSSKPTNGTPATTKSPAPGGSSVAKSAPQTSVSIDQKPASSPSGTEADRINKQETAHG